MNVYSHQVSLLISHCIDEVTDIANMYLSDPAYPLKKCLLLINANAAFFLFFSFFFYPIIKKYDEQIEDQTGFSVGEAEAKNVFVIKTILEKRIHIEATLITATKNIYKENGIILVGILNFVPKLQGTPLTSTYV